MYGGGFTVLSTRPSPPTPTPTPDAPPEVDPLDAARAEHTAALRAWIQSNDPADRMRYRQALHVVRAMTR
jgi:hypothetical protein